MSFQDKVAIVTGASSGIGAAVAIALSAAGASVVIVGRNETKLAATAARCANALLVRADVTSDDDARTIVNRTIETFGRIDILVNNAGGSRYVNIFDKDNIMEAYDFTIDVNLRAVFHITSLALPFLMKTKGNIINISSTGGHSTQLDSNMIAYSTSKAAVSHLGACLAADLAPHGVRVNTISPGPVRTDYLENNNMPATWDDFAKQTALGRVSEPQEIADLVAFVASDKAKSMTGSNVFSDNGWMIQRHLPVN